MKAQFLSCRKSPEPHNLISPAKMSPGRPVLPTAVRQAEERTWHRSVLSQEKGCSCTHEWRQSGRNGPRAVRPAKQQSGDVLSTQQLMARDEQGDPSTPYCMGQTCSKAQNTSSAGWRSLCIQRLLPRLLLPPQKPQRDLSSPGR